MTCSEFSIKETAKLVEKFEGLNSNPYDDYRAFQKEVREIVAQNNALFAEIGTVAELVQGEAQNRRVVMIKGCPIDANIPIFDANNALNDKHSLKKTFVGEGFLESVSQICDFPIVSYTTRNEGDFFQDVYAESKYASTQTQKTDSDLFFHNDRAAHRVRPDVLCLLSMRSDPANVITTKYVHGEDILSHIDPSLHEVLRKPYYMTPFDPVSRDSNTNHVDSESHPIFIDEVVRYHATVTSVAKDAPEIAWRALSAFLDAITKAPQVRVPIHSGELFIFPNLEGLHSRDRAHITNPETAKQRYLLKTYNFWSTERANRFDEFYVSGLPGLVDDLAVDASMQVAV